MPDPDERLWVRTDIIAERAFMRDGWCWIYRQHDDGFSYYRIAPPLIAEEYWSEGGRVTADGRVAFRGVLYDVAPLPPPCDVAFALLVPVGPADVPPGEPVAPEDRS